MLCQLGSFISPSRLKHEFQDHDPDVRVRAILKFEKLVKASAADAAIASKDMLPCLRDDDIRIRSETLGVFRKLAESGQAQQIGVHASEFVGCLSDQDLGVQRKAAVLCRVLAEEGAAAFFAAHVPKLLECFTNNRTSAAPLNAIIAILIAGETNAVSCCIMEFFKALSHTSSNVRTAACEAIGVFAQRGDVGLLMCASLSFGSTSTAVPDITPLLDMLISLLRDDEVRLAAARTLQHIADSDPESAVAINVKHDFTLFTSACGRNGRADPEFQSVLLAILNNAASVAARQTAHVVTTTSAAVSNEADGETDDSDELECVICQCNHPKLDRMTLPCQHSFHSHCLESWFKYKQACGHQQTCPMCRWTKDPKPKPKHPRALGRQAPTSNQSSAPAPAPLSQRSQGSVSVVQDSRAQRIVSGSGSNRSVSRLSQRESRSARSAAHLHTGSSSLRAAAAARSNIS